MGNSFGCSASREHMVSAARDGYLKEAKYLLECNPRLAKYSTFRCSKFSSALFSSSTTEWGIGKFSLYFWHCQAMISDD